MDITIITIRAGNSVSEVQKVNGALGSQQILPVSDAYRATIDQDFSEAGLFVILQRSLDGTTFPQNEEGLNLVGGPGAYGVSDISSLGAVPFIRARLITIEGEALAGVEAEEDITIYVSTL